MKYRLDREYYDLIDVASEYKTDVNKHYVTDYVIDAAVQYIASTFSHEEGEAERYSINRYSQKGHGNDRSVYTVCIIKFTGAGSLTFFGEAIDLPKNLMIVDRPAPEPTIKDEEDDKPIDLSEIPF